MDLEDEQLLSAPQPLKLREDFRKESETRTHSLCLFSVSGITHRSNCTGAARMALHHQKRCPLDCLECDIFNPPGNYPANQPIRRSMIDLGYEQLEKLPAPEIFVRELQKVADRLKAVTQLASPVSSTWIFLSGLQGEFANHQMRHRDLQAVNWIQEVECGDSIDTSFVKPERNLLDFCYNPTKLSSGDCPECDDTAIKDQCFSFRSKEEVSHDDAVEFLFSQESDGQGLTDKTSGLSHTKHTEGVDAPTEGHIRMAKFESFLKQRIEEAVEPLIGPVALALHTRAKAERKRRESILALQEKQLALRGKRIRSLKRHRDGQSQRRRSGSKVHRSSRIVRRLQRKSARMM